jgi:hypothetical protein
VVRGAPLAAHLRHVGWVEGVVAWVQDNRFGIAFAEPIDPKLVREPVATSRPTITPALCAPSAEPAGSGRLRKLEAGRRPISPDLYWPATIDLLGKVAWLIGPAIRAARSWR